MQTDIDRTASGTRRAGAALVAVLAGVLLLATPAAAQTPQRGGTLAFAVVDEPTNYDCHANSSFAFIHPARPHYSTLLKFDPAAYPKVVGDLAAAWTVSRDGLAYTFRLRSNVKFHDGTPLTAEDVKATYERLRNPVGGARSVRRAAYADIASIWAPDPLTVIFRLKRPNASMLSNFASPWNCIYSAAKLKQDPRWPERNVMGTGPFTFVEHVAGSHWAGKRFDGYYEPGKPYLDGYRAVFVSGARMLDALASGQVLAEFRGHAPPDRDRLVSGLGDRAVVTESPWVCNLVVSFNTQKEPFDDARVRRALSLAIDRRAGGELLSRSTLVRYVGGLLRPGYELAASEEELARLPGFARDVQKARAEARELLQDAGKPNLTFKLTNRNIAMPYTAVGEFLIDQWRQIGVTAQHERLETEQYLAAQQGAAPPYAAALDFNCDYVDEPNLQLLKYLSFDRSPINHAGYIDTTLDFLYNKQSGELDKKKRYDVLREFERHVLEQAYIVPTLWWHRIIVHNRQLRGWHITPSHYLSQDLADVWLER